MREVIIEKLKQIEQQENITILHAVESGSRAWGFESSDSDFDVRFIYVRPKNYYLKLEQTRDVLEFPINDGCKRLGFAEGITAFASLQSVGIRMVQVAGCL